MKDLLEKSVSDFAGFINGFQASNLETIQRNIALQLSEMQTRAGVIKTQISADHEIESLNPAFSKIEEIFKDGSGTIVDRLVTVGQRLNEFLIKHGNQIKNKPVYSQIVGFARAYITAAEISRNERMIEAALQVAERWKPAGG